MARGSLVLVAEPIHEDVICSPGANRSTQEPKFEKLERVSVMLDAATVMALGVEAGENIWYFDDQKRTVAQMRGGKAVATYDPGEAVYDWPLAVGKAWTAKYRYLNHATGQATDVQFEVKVESYEKVDTPAGSFDAYRISMTSPTAKLTRWYSPVLGILVKDRFERTAANRLGTGTRESVLLSQHIVP